MGSWIFILTACTAYFIVGAFIGILVYFASMMEEASVPKCFVHFFLAMLLWPIIIVTYLIMLWVQTMLEHHADKTKER